MKAQELRIGDKVYCTQVREVNSSGYTPFTISAISVTGSVGLFVQFEETENQPVAIESLQGIPLTDEVLEAAGFERKKGVSNIYDKGKIRVAIDIHALFYLTKTGDVDFIGPIMCLHELQNAYRVFNSWQELTFNLNQLQ